jgi:serine/threonine protein kinase
MTTGLPPFYSENVNLMYKKILHNELLFPPGFSEKAQTLVRGVSFPTLMILVLYFSVRNYIMFTPLHPQLLDRDPKKRLGGGPNDAEDIKRHPYFADVDWDKLFKKQVKPPFKPKVVSIYSKWNFCELVGHSCNS